jgi:hypothetical protein
LRLDFQLLTEWLHAAALPVLTLCLQLRLSGAEDQLAEAQAERDQLRQQLARVRGSMAHRGVLP